LKTGESGYDKTPCKQVECTASCTVNCRRRRP